MTEVANTTRSLAGEGTAETTPSERVERQLKLERDYVRVLYSRLDDLREEKSAELAKVRRTDTGGNHQSRSERDAFATHYEDRLAQLNSVDNRLVFGRLDTTGEDGEHTRYIGRIGLATEDHQRLMVDWRAREAAAFYQATGRHPMGVRRRHLILDGREVSAIEDDVLDPEMLDDDGVLQGEGALLAALNSKRTGRMTDIVSTIQAEQDRIIRAPLPGVHVVQGGPGTGKTAVALHRAAYLLYEHRERLRKSGVLIVGPSSSFLWYIDRVLPSLGETGVVMSSLADLYPGVHGVPERDREVVRIKADLHMAEVVRQAVRDRQKVPAQDQVLHADSYEVVLPRKLVRRARDKARATGKPHNEARGTFVKIVLRDLAESLGEDLNKRSGNVMDRSYLVEDLRQSPEVRKAINLCWLPLSPETLVRQLFAKRRYLDSAFRDYSARERALLERPADAPLTVSDVPLLDEAAELLGDLEGAGVRITTTEAERAKATENAEKALYNMHQSLEDVGVDGVVTAADLTAFNEEAEHRMTAVEAAHADRTWAYGHVVVDEAQELTPMQWRVLMRRCPMKSFTVVGDIAQGGSASAAKSWSAALGPFVKDRFELDELTVNYRTPAAIADAAVAVARAAGLEISAPKAVRDGEAPLVTGLPQSAGDESLTQAVVDQTEAEVDAVEGGLVAVIAAEHRIGALGSALSERLPGKVGAGMRRIDNQVVVLSPWDAKGLEFDSVVLVQPAEIVDDDDGVGSLYVAMTRPTQRLRVIGSGELPEGLSPSS
ncbi:AAA family ATPase [Kocuria coralli]|uniref:AAA family ATPase n=1 Tax=Kocuria coralli TaxID=1461025 RepID=A0A5J5KV69_9MICC|nr:AAA family ATPase [Kocuria coralli]KAA9393543.1 AAA family ATPase [Kocuria coralli]